MRTCAGCRLRGEPDDLVRVFLLGTRGIWLHPRSSCVEALGRRRGDEVAALTTAVRAETVASAVSALRRAHREGRVVSGWRRARSLDGAWAAFLAKDAREPAVPIAIRGRLPWSRVELGAILCRGPRAVVAVRLEPGMERAAKRLRWVLDLG